MSYTAQPNPDCISFCPVIQQDRIAMEYLDDKSMAEADYLRHCQQSKECGGAVVRAGFLGTEVVCPRFGSTILHQ